MHKYLTKSLPAYAFNACEIHPAMTFSVEFSSAGGEDDQKMPILR